MTDLSKRDVATLLGQWHEVTDQHDCWSAEIQLDAAIRAGLHQEAEIARLEREVDGARLTVARQALRIAAQEAQIRRLTEGGPRTRSERIVSALQALRQTEHSP